MKVIGDGSRDARERACASCLIFDMQMGVLM